MTEARLAIPAGCPEAHTINRDGDLYWITCGSAENRLGTMQLHPQSPVDQVQQWARAVIDGHQIEWLRAEVERLRASRR